MAGSLAGCRGVLTGDTPGSFVGSVAFSSDAKDGRRQAVSSTTLAGVEPLLAARQFVAFGLSHGVVVVAVAVVAAVLVVVGRRHRGAATELLVTGRSRWCS